MAIKFAINDTLRPETGFSRFASLDRSKRAHSKTTLRGFPYNVAIFSCCVCFAFCLVSSCARLILMPLNCLCWVCCWALMRLIKICNRFGNISVRLRDCQPFPPASQNVRHIHSLSSFLFLKYSNDVPYANITP